MKRLFYLLICCPLFVIAQKKPLDHSVYDGWQSIGGRFISNDGRWVAYTVRPQEGDAMLYVQSADGRTYRKEIPRGDSAVITEDNKYVIFKIRPLFKDTRDAKIKKKRPEEMPKDSIGILELGKDNVIKVARVRTFKTPEKASGWLAYHKERDVAPVRPGGNSSTQRTVDSLRQKIDSLSMLVTELKNIKGGNKDASDADDDPVAPGSGNEGSDLVLRDLAAGKDKLFKNVVDYSFSKYGQKLVLRFAKDPRDSTSKNSVAVYDIAKGKLQTIMKGGNDFRNFAFNEDGSRLAFVAERDTNSKALQRFYSLYVYKSAEDSATLLVDKKSAGMHLGTTVSEWGVPAFSKSGNRLFFGTAAIQPPRDTSIVDFEVAKLDIWNYKDDYLQSQQLFNLRNELRRNYLAVYDFSQHKLEQLASKDIPTIIQTNEGDGDVFVAVTDTGRRVQAQWTGGTLKDVYAVNVRTGARTLVKRNHDGQIYASSTGKYILLYDVKTKNYWAWNGTSLKNITSGIKVSLFNEEHDTPDDPNPYGVMGWSEGDNAVYIYDRYDVWKVDPTGSAAPVNITAVGRKQKDTYRYSRVNREEKFLKPGQPVFFRVQNDITKKMGFVYDNLSDHLQMKTLVFGENSFGALDKADDANVFTYTKESYTQSPDLYVNNLTNSSEVKLSATNPQQAEYNWGTAELVNWKTFNGKESTGILYKPEDFDPKKKYPMLVYFYEKVSDGLYGYVPPSPTPSRLNISFFVSRGYLVFTPDISYTKGHPGKDAYNYIVSGTQALAKNPWVDAKNIGIQGQSWGGYQVAYLITATPMFKAAWAGAPVVNMFSAYGGIRWESGLNRQFQYEKGQSRIGSTPWEHPELYIENSPLFHLPKVKTPLVIMSNDADGAVPWYQGIEFFTDMRRLGKPVWLLNYNGEAHNLVERRNRKDIQIREQQFFDWLLKGEKPAKWITEGVPAVKKGKDWGLEIVEGEPVKKKL